MIIEPNPSGIGNPFTTAGPSDSPTRSRLFLTGGSGYVGRNLIRYFKGRGIEVVALARTGHSADIVRALGAVPFEGDLLSKNLADGLRGCDRLVHAAADTSHGPETARLHQVNVDGTYHLLDAARRAGIGKVVHMSSESVLLDGKPLILATEAHPLPVKPAGGYSRTKAKAEKIALSLATLDFQVVVVRPRFVWGRDDTTALPHLLAAARSGHFAWINGGHYLTSTTHIANLCEGVGLALEKGRSGEVYFITDGEPVAFRTIVSGLLRTRQVIPPDKNVPRWLLRALATFGDAIEGLSRGHIKAPINRQSFSTSAVEVTLDITKARSELGYEPILSMDEGLAEMLREPAP